MNPPVSERQGVRLGACYLIASAAVFSCVGALVKHLSGSLPVEMVVFFRNGAGLVFLLPLLLTGRISLRTSRLGDHALRAVSGVLAMYCFFYAIAKLHLAEAIVLNFASPLLIPVFAYFLIGERLPRAMGLLLAAGFIGVVLVMKPGVGVFKPAALVGLVSAVFAAFALVNIRRLASTEPVMQIVFYFALIGSIITVFPMLRVWIHPNPVQWVLLFAVGTFATVGQSLLTLGYACAPAGRIGYFQYSAVVFAGVVDWVIWGSRLDGLSIAGIVLICLAGIAATRFKDEAPEAPPPT